MCIDVEVSCSCDICGADVYADNAIILCEECYEKVDDEPSPGYHLVTNEEFYCHKEKVTMLLFECNDRISFCPFCGDRLVK